MFSSCGTGQLSAILWMPLEWIYAIRTILTPYRRISVSFSDLISSYIGWPIRKITVLVYSGGVILNILWLSRFLFANILTGNMIFITRFLFFLLLGTVIRLFVSTRRAYHILSAGIAVGWLICEIFADIGASFIDFGIAFFGLVFHGGLFFLQSGIGFFICHAVCLLLHKRKLIE